MIVIDRPTFNTLQPPTLDRHHQQHYQQQYYHSTILRPPRRWSPWSLSRAFVYGRSINKHDIILFWRIYVGVTTTVPLHHHHYHRPPPPTITQRIHFRRRRRIRYPWVDGLNMSRAHITLPKYYCISPIPYSLRWMNDGPICHESCHTIKRMRPRRPIGIYSF